MASRNVLIFLKLTLASLSISGLAPNRSRFKKIARPAFAYTFPARSNKITALTHRPRKCMPAKSIFVRVKFIGDDRGTTETVIILYTG